MDVALSDPRKACRSRRFAAGVAWMVSLLGLLTASCGPYPRDIEGSFDRIGTSKVIRVGVVEGSIRPTNSAVATAYLRRLRAATGATPRITSGSSEPLLASLETGDLDLVIGEFALDSPWNTQATLIEPIAERTVGDRPIGLSPIARNGENRWIMVLEREVRDLKAGE